MTVIFNSSSFRRFASVTLLALCVALTACASRVVMHSFTLEPQDNPDIEVLDYYYGDTRTPGARASEQDKADGQVRQRVGITGEMRRGDRLYVKWRVTTTGAVYEDLVDLKSVLPTDIKNHRIYATISGPRLIVYLIAPHKRLPSEPELGPEMYHDRKVIELSSKYGRSVTK